MVRTAALIVTAGILALAPAHAKPTKKEREAIASSPEQVASKVIVTDEPLETYIKFSTEQFLPYKVNFMGVGADKYLRAFVDKKTGETLIQIYVWTQYNAQTWAFYNGLNYETANGPVEAKFTSLSQDVSCSNASYCTYRESFGAEIPEGILRDVAAHPDAIAGTDAVWSFRVKARQAEGLNTGLLKTEVAGLLIAMDRERSKRGILQK